MDFLSVLLGLVAGGIITFVLLNLLNKKKGVSQAEYDSLNAKYNEITLHAKITEARTRDHEAGYQSLNDKLNIKESEVLELRTGIAGMEEKLRNQESKINELAVVAEKSSEKNKILQEEVNGQLPKIAALSAENTALTENLKKQNEINKSQNQQLDDYINKLSDAKGIINRLEANNTSLSEKLETQKKEIEEMQKTAHLQFEKIANKIFEEKSTRFTESNKTGIETLLKPLKEDINKFKEKIEATHTEDTKQRSTLEERIKGLIEQTNMVSKEANNLALALKGKSQKRGNWGELILERILETSGLTKEREYFIQKNAINENGNTVRPDVMVKLPDSRIIMIDSKVSLIAYDNYVNTDDIDLQKKFLTEHIKATKKHVDELSSKSYDELDKNSLDFTMMFIPIEPAYLLAIQGENDLWSYAYDKRILLVSQSTLVACLKLFSDLWRREWQNKNALEIVTRGEKMYEKFIGFLVNFEAIGNNLATTQRTYKDALGQLKSGRGNLIDQATKLKNLGLKSDKKVPQKLLGTSIEDNDIEVEASELENTTKN